jgi:hypothetical protein
MNLTKYFLAVLALFALVACGSSDPKTLVKEGQTALGSGDSGKALGKFDEALKQLKPADQLYKDAKLGRAEALIPSDPKKTVDEFMKLVNEMPEKIGPKDFLWMSGQMISAHKYLEAIDLVENGRKREGGKSPELMARIERIKKEAANDKAVSDKLRGLGYVQ